MSVFSALTSLFRSRAGEYDAANTNDRPSDTDSSNNLSAQGTFSVLEESADSAVDASHLLLSQPAAGNGLETNLLSERHCRPSESYGRRLATWFRHLFRSGHQEPDPLAHIPDYLFMITTEQRIQLGIGDVSLFLEEMVQRNNEIDRSSLTVQMSAELEMYEKDATEILGAMTETYVVSKDIKIKPFLVTMDIRIKLLNLLKSLYYFYVTNGHSNLAEQCLAFAKYVKFGGVTSFPKDLECLPEEPEKIKVVDHDVLDSPSTDYSTAHFTVLDVNEFLTKAVADHNDFEGAYRAKKEEFSGVMTEEDQGLLRDSFDAAADGLEKIRSILVIDCEDIEDSEESEESEVTRTVTALEVTNDVGISPVQVHDVLAQLESMQNGYGIVKEVLQTQTQGLGVLGLRCQELATACKALEVKIKHNLNLNEYDQFLKGENNVDSFEYETEFTAKKAAEMLGKLQASFEEEDSAIGHLTGRNKQQRETTLKKIVQLKARVNEYMAGSRGYRIHPADYAVPDNPLDSVRLTAQELAYFAQKLKKIEHECQKYGFSGTKDMARLAAKRVKWDWLKVMEEREKGRLRKELAYLEEVGSKHVNVTGFRPTVGIGWTVPGVSFNNEYDVGVSTTCTFGVRHTNQVYKDDEGSLVDLDVVDGHVSGGIGAGLPFFETGIAKFAAVAKASVGLSIGRGEFREYNGLSNYIDKKASTHGWASLSHSAETSKVKKRVLGMQRHIPVVGKYTSDLRKLKGATQFAIDSSPALKEAFNGQHFDFKTPVRPVVVMRDGIFKRTSGDLKGAALTEVRLGSAAVAARIGAGIEVSLKQEQVHANELVADHMLNVTANDPRRLRELPKSSTLWLKNQLGITADKQLFIKGVNEEDTTVNSKEITSHPKEHGQTHLALNGEEPESITSRDSRALDVLATFELKVEHFMTYSAKHDYLESIKAKTSDQKAAFTKVKNELAKMYHECGVNPKGSSPRHYMLQTLTVTLAHLTNYLAKGENTLSQQQNEGIPVRLEALKATLINPSINHSRGFLQRLTCFKFKAPTGGNKTSGETTIKFGPVDLKAKVTYTDAWHTNYLRQGKFIDINLSAGLGIDLQEDLVGAKIKMGLGEILNNMGLDATEFFGDLVLDFSLEGEWGVSYRFFKPDYRDSDDYHGDNKYRLQFVRKFTTLTGDLGLGTNVSIPLTSTIVGGKIDNSYSKTKITSEALGTNDLSYLMMRFNRYYSANGFSLGHPLWQEFMGNHEREFCRIYKGLADDNSPAQADLNYFFEKDIIPKAEKEGAESVVEVETMRDYIINTMKAYYQLPSDQNKQACDEAMTAFLKMQGPTWFERNKAAWDKKKFGSNGGVSWQEVGNHISRAFGQGNSKL